jgi:hypothetical protein
MQQSHNRAITNILLWWKGDKLHSSPVFTVTSREVGNLNDTLKDVKSYVYGSNKVFRNCLDFLGEVLSSDVIVS